MDLENIKDIRRAFSDISRGYSLIADGKDKFYIKHLSHHDQVDLDVVQDRHFNEAKDKGVPLNEDRLRFLIDEEESWAEKDEKYLITQADHILSLEDGKKHLTFKRDIDSQNKSIVEEKRKLAEKKGEKANLMGMTCELYGENKVNEYYVVESLFWDKEFKNKVIDEDTSELPDEDLYRYIKIHNKSSFILSEKNIKLLAIQDFFLVYWKMTDNDVFKFFGCPVVNLTYFQIRLSGYANMYSNILKEVNGIPEDARQDPDKLMDYAVANKNASEKMAKHGDQGAVSLVGATKEDYKRMGIEESEMIRPSDFMKKKGKKKLNMKEIMEMEGYK